jgi:ankyrin repeat protein
MTPLMMAILANNEYAARRLLEKPDLRFDTDFNGASALACCAAKGNITVAQLLLARHWVDVNRASFGVPPLHAACRKGHGKMIDFLIAHGADMELRDNAGRTPLLEAVMHASYEAVLYLCEAGASVSAVDDAGCGVLHYGVGDHKEGIVEYLLSTENVTAMIDNQDAAGDTALHIAIRERCGPVAKLLVDAGARTDVVNKDGETALLLAKRRFIQLFPDRVIQNDELQDVSLPKHDGSEDTLCQNEPTKEIDQASLFSQETSQDFVVRLKTP